MSAADVSEGSEFAELDEDRPVGVAAQGHPCLEEDVRSRLTGQFSLVPRIACLAQRLREARLIVAGEENDNRLRASKGCGEDVRDVWARAAAVLRLAPKVSRRCPSQPDVILTGSREMAHGERDHTAPTRTLLPRRTPSTVWTLGMLCPFRIGGRMAPLIPRPDQPVVEQRPI
jgi:hypothetical protein